MKTYTIMYRMRQSPAAETKIIKVEAQNRMDAYDIAVYEAIPKREGCCPYSAWVTSVTYANGCRHGFNTIEGFPF